MLVKEELVEIKGGVTKWAVGLAIGSVITFLIGLIDGYLRPLPCHER